MTEENYIVLKHRGILSVYFIMAIFGLLSLLIVIICGLGAMLNSFVISGSLLGFFILVGCPFCIAWFPASYRSGCELDMENNRFREYEGTFGKDKGDWIEVKSSDYVSIIGVNAKVLGQSRTSVSTYSFKACKVYFNSNGWHLEILKSSYSHAKEYAQVFSDTFGIEINDVNKTQNLKSGGSGF
mgnify:CR=1 FL=1